MLHLYDTNCQEISGFDTHPELCYFSIINFK